MMAYSEVIGDLIFLDTLSKSEGNVSAYIMLFISYLTLDQVLNIPDVLSLWGEGFSLAQLLEISCKT